MLTKSNRTEIQSYEVEEQTFGTPCITFLTVRGRVLSQTLTTRRLCCHFSHYIILKPSQSAGVHTDTKEQFLSLWFSITAKNEKENLVDSTVRVRHKHGDIKV